MKTPLIKIHHLAALLLATYSLIACQPTTAPSNDPVTTTVTTPDPIAAPPTTAPSNDLAIATTATPNPVAAKPMAAAVLDSAPPLVFPWLNTYAPSAALQQQIPVPEGYERLPLAKNAFGTWLRRLPLHPKGTPVLLYNGDNKPYQAGAYRVVDIDIGSRDLQQCADAVMRLRAEYLYQQKEYAAIHFNYTSGHTIRFSDWSQGKRPKVKGSKVYFTAPQGATDVSYKQFKRYLTNVYSYAGTASLSKEVLPKALENIQPGDLFIQGGFPGHAVLVMDVVQHTTTGKRLFLLAQSYMPAQSIHILHNPQQSALSPWYNNDFTGTLATPEWNFSAQDLRQFEQ